MEIPHTSITYQTVARDRPISAIRINAAAGDPCRGWLTADGQTLSVALGRGGIRANKREGDGGTPKGTFRPRQLWWRADRHPRPRTFYLSAPSGPKTLGAKIPKAAITTSRYGLSPVAAAIGSRATTTSMISLSRSITTAPRASPAAAALYSCTWRARISRRPQDAYR